MLNQTIIPYDLTAEQIDILYKLLPESTENVLKEEKEDVKVHSGARKPTRK